jgi:hypothetical protein
MTKRVWALALSFPLFITAAVAQEQNVPIQIRRATGSISIDGNLNDPGWQNASRIDKFYETNPGDNIEPSAKSVGYLAYDDQFLYAAFEFSDPHPSQIRAPYNDRDNIGGMTDDYGGIIVDTRNDRKTAVLLLANARAIQYDAITDDSSGEDSSPDWFWDAATSITETGWRLEMRVPFSSLRYEGRQGPQEWGILLYRNMPRDRRYQMFSGRLPRGGNCFICHRNPLIGLSDLPSGGHFVAAPYLAARQISTPRGDVLGNEFVNRPPAADAGLDFKWTPTANTAIDATINPDFSQVESDVAAISTNERFAIFFPEKRPFFLEGVELFATPLTAAYTRTITSPRWGLRTTGNVAGNRYTVLVAQDRGGGDVVIPSREGSSFAFQDFESTALIGRVRRDFGTSFVSFLTTMRESEDGAHNRVFGPDFRWQIGDTDTVTAQLLYTDTKTPNRPELSAEWDGRQQQDFGGEIWWSHSTRTLDTFLWYRNIGEDFRADNGFIPQVGYELSYGEIGYTFRRDNHTFHRIRPFAYGQYESGQDGDKLYSLVTAGVAADGKYRSFTRLRYARDAVRTNETILERDRLYYQVEFSPTKRIARVTLNGWVGDSIDFIRSRLGRGASVALGGTVRPTDHLQLGLTNTVQWLNIGGDRLFTSQIERLNATYTFNSKMFLRTILQNTRDNFDRDLYGFRPDEFPQHTGNFAMQLLFAYKLNWQTVMYVGLSDLREVTGEEGDLEPSERQLFMKVSYAFQR